MSASEFLRSRTLGSARAIRPALCAASADGWKRELNRAVLLSTELVASSRARGRGNYRVCPGSQFAKPYRNSFREGLIEQRQGSGSFVREPVWPGWSNLSLI